MNKKLLFMLLFTTLITVNVFADDLLNETNSNSIDVAMIALDDCIVYVPARSTLIELGYTVEWHEYENRVYFYNDDTFGYFIIGNTTYNYCTNNVTLKYPPILYDDKTYVPINFIDDLLLKDYYFTSEFLNIYE